MSKEFIDSLRTMLIESGLVKLDKIEGCSEAEIKQLCIDQSVACLPLVYKQVMEIFGKKSGKFLQEPYFRFPEILSLKIDLNKSIRFLENTFIVPEDAFIFMCTNGYAWWYFHTENCEDDPQVYLYDDNNNVVLFSERLSQFFIDMANEEINLMNQKY